MAAPSGSQVCKGNVDHIQRLRRMTMTLATRWSGTTSAGGVYLRSVPYHERRSGCWTNILKLGHAPQSLCYPASGCNYRTTRACAARLAELSALAYLASALTPAAPDRMGYIGQTRRALPCSDDVTQLPHAA
jgi:hypothetical protein